MKRVSSNGERACTRIMRSKLIVLSLILLVLLGLSGGYVVGGLQAYSRFQQSNLANEQHCGGQEPVHICVQTPMEIFSAFYPSYVANQTHQFTVKYSSSSPRTLLVSLSIVGMSEVQTQTVNATATTQFAYFVPPLISQSFRKLTFEDSTSVQVQVTDTARHIYYLNDIHLLLHSRWLMQWVASNRLQIGAWVTPDDPAVNTLVSQASSYLHLEPPPTPPAMIGYNRADAREVVAQVDAIYDTLLLRYDIQYLQASVPYGGPNSSTAATENIKLPAEVLQQKSGMCIELTVLLASAVERIGLQAEVVIIPGHAFLGVSVTPDSKHFEYWDAAQMSNKVAGDSDNVSTDALYTSNVKDHTIVDTILINDARNANINAML